MDNKELGFRLASRRNELQLTLKDVAEKVGIASSTVLRYEQGNVSKIKLPVIEAISKALGVNPAWVCGKSDDKFLPARNNVQVRDENDNLVVLDEETRSIIDSLRSRPDMKMLFSVSKGATPEDIITAVKIIEALKNKGEGDR